MGASASSQASFGVNTGKIIATQQLAAKNNITIQAAALQIAATDKAAADKAAAAKAIADKAAAAQQAADVKRINDANIGYKFVGCYKDQDSRALPTLVGLVDKNNAVKTCYNNIKPGHKYFAIQSGNECRAGDSGYDKYGAVTTCDINQGGAWVNAVYENVSPVPVCTGFQTPGCALTQYGQFGLRNQFDGTVINIYDDNHGFGFNKGNTLNYINGGDMADIKVSYINDTDFNLIYTVNGVDKVLNNAHQDDIVSYDNQVDNSSSNAIWSFNISNGIANQIKNKQSGGYWALNTWGDQLNPSAWAAVWAQGGYKPLKIIVVKPSPLIVKYNDVLNNKIKCCTGEYDEAVYGDICKSLDIWNSDGNYTPTCNSLLRTNCANGDNFNTATCKKWCLAKPFECMDTATTFCGKDKNYLSDNCKSFCSIPDQNIANQCNTMLVTKCTDPANKDPWCSCYKPLNTFAGFEKIDPLKNNLTRCFIPECKNYGFKATLQADPACPSCIQDLSIGGSAEYNAQDIKQTCGTDLGIPKPAIPTPVPPAASPSSIVPVTSPTSVPVISPISAVPVVPAISAAPATPTAITASSDTKTSPDDSITNAVAYQTPTIAGSFSELGTIMKSNIGITIGITVVLVTLLVVFTVKK
ncbi:MAG: halomucin [Faunusvirus sp.]|jgi:hypothetical protein|uniref:Halomucin n=1 Tax=Faunusvirus sp. TaxID=2487766 RepID=A0A3G5A1A3_9VIRU|nr:MAG: halomucin [Faunusvirus sp.]